MTTAMIAPTLAERYSAHSRCAPGVVQREIFWRTLHRHALPLAPLLGARYFESDRRLIDACARATSLEQVRDEIHMHPIHAYYGRWLHRHARIRISTLRLRRLAAQCFSPPVPGC